MHNCLKGAEVQDVINSLNPKKSSGYNIIIDKILTELPIIGINYLIQLFNAVLLNGFFLAQWKITQMILILKPGSPHNELTSYWPVSILPIVSKVSEKLLLKRPLPMVQNSRLVPTHQFVFKQRYSTIGRIKSYEG
jgi:hypothetical protein